MVSPTSLLVPPLPRFSQRDRSESDALDAESLAYDETLRKRGHFIAAHFCVPADFAHSPATCLVLTLIRFQTLVMEIQRIRLASARSS